MLALVSYAAYFLYQHRPDIKLTMIAPSEFPKLQIDSTPVKFDTQKLRFSDANSRPPQLNVGKLQFGPPPQLQIAKLQFDTPPLLKFEPFPELKLADNSRIKLELSENTKMKFEPLRFQDDCHSRKVR